MAVEGLPIDRLREYLAALPSGARVMLITTIERGALQGQDLPGAGLILEALRHGMRSDDAPARIGTPERLFFAPLEPILVDRGPRRELPGRIERASLTPLWNWIGRDLLPDEMAAYHTEASQALLAGERDYAETLAQRFQERVADAITAHIADAGTDERLRRRTMAQIALPRAVADLQNLHCVLSNRAAIAGFAARIPASIAHLGEHQADNIGRLALKTAAGQPDLLQILLNIVMNRLGSRWQLIRLALRAAESDAAHRLVNSPLARAVPLVFADMRATIGELRADFVAGRLAEARIACRILHDTIRAVRTEIDLSADTPWAREFGALRAEVADVVAAQIEATPGLVRRLLRLRAPKEMSPGAWFDAADVDEAQARIELTIACRNYAGELAINNVAPRVHTELREYFEMRMPPLIDSLRTAGGSEQTYRQQQVDAAVRLAGTLFDADYAALLSKAAAVAQADPKMARA